MLSARVWVRMLDIRGYILDLRFVLLQCNIYYEPVQSMLLLQCVFLLLRAARGHEPCIKNVTHQRNQSLAHIRYPTISKKQAVHHLSNIHSRLLFCWYRYLAASASPVSSSSATPQYNLTCPVSYNWKNM